MSLIKESKHLRIPFESIKEATENFTTLIGKGGYGPVYRGQLSLSGKLTLVAVKRLRIDNLSGQGLKEFLTEIQLLSRYKHQNLVSLVGFCEEANDKFLIYEYAEHGSLDRYLKPYKTSCPLTWMQRIKICVDAARGLDHLHNHVAHNQRVIHRDIKSANILIDHNWKAMIADFGLSKIGRANEIDTYLITNASGTHGYCDPAYIHTGILTKESDVYSFGVVLLEVLCGRLCFINVNGKERFLAPLAQRYYNEDKFNLIIDPNLKFHMNSYSIQVFLEIAFQCVQDDRYRRPPIDLVLQKLEEALKLLVIEEEPELLELEEALGLRMLVETLQIQQFEDAFEMQELEEAMGLNRLVEKLQIQQFEEAREIQELEELEEALGLPRLVEALKLHEFKEALKLQIGESGYEVIKAAHYSLGTPLSYTNRNRIISCISTGVLISEGWVWLLMDDDGKTQEMISALMLMDFTPDFYHGDKCRFRPEQNSRFPKVAEVFLKGPSSMSMPFRIRTQFLSPYVKYAAYLMCKPKSRARMRECDKHSLRYTLNCGSESYISYPSKMEGNGWWMFELFQTIRSKRDACFEVAFQMMKTCVNPWSSLLIEGIKFLPIHKFEDEDEIENPELERLSTANIEWDDRLPSNYKQLIYHSNREMMQKAQGDLIFPTKEEAYFILSRGVHIKVNHQLNMRFWITELYGRNCFVLPPTLVSYDRGFANLKPITPKISRNETVLHLSSSSKVVGMRFKVPTGLLSANTTYGYYLVYKLPQGFGSLLVVNMKLLADDGVLTGQHGKLVYMSIPQIPVIGPDGVVSTSSNPINRLDTIQLPRKRKDGWLEVNLGNMSDIQWKNMAQKEPFDFQPRKKSLWESWFPSCISDNELSNVSHTITADDTNSSFTLDPLYFSNIDLHMWAPYGEMWDQKLVVQGIEFRPL